MNRILIGLAASAVMLSASAGAFAAAKLDTMDRDSPSQNGAVRLAQAAGSTQGGTGGAQVLEEQKKKEMDKNNAAATSGAAASTPENTDASQSKRTGDEKPANSGSK
jgi:hypothetical protein